MDSIRLSVIVGCDITKGELKLITPDRLGALIHLWTCKGYVSDKEVPTPRMIMDYWLGASEGSCKYGDASSLFSDGDFFFGHDTWSENPATITRIQELRHTCIGLQRIDSVAVQEYDDGPKRLCLGVLACSVDLTRAAGFDNNLSAYEQLYAPVREQLASLGMGDRVQMWLTTFLAYT